MNDLNKYNLFEDVLISMLFQTHVLPFEFDGQIVTLAFNFVLPRVTSIYY